ncbi:SH3 domain-containing protein [Phycisphaerales bacterium AB-hyl4]|uniref:SH3 domain-containing protein n=1 Tax=Natronomicrosphaera hydrolytica TaxID=3242702 RepID=A0ABV4U9X5_9BACT
MMMFRGWMGRFAPVLLVSLLLMPAATPATAQEVPYTAIVVEDNVQVRAGAGRAYYVVGELDRGALVEVEEVIFGWLKVVPPEGVHSYISKAFVDARGEGRRGEVNSNRTRVTAASVEGPGNSYREQTLLNRGAAVRIVDEEGSFYKIEPPAGTFVFLPPGSVRRASDMEAAQEPEQPAEQEAEPAAEPEQPTEAEPTEQVADDEADQPVEVADSNGEAETDIEGAVTSEDLPELAGDESGQEDQDSLMPTPDQRVDEGDADATADDEALTENATEPEAEEAVAEQPREEVDTPAISEALREVEHRHVPAFDLPLEEQPFERMIADYRAVLANNDDLPTGDQRLIEHRLSLLERNQRIAETLVRVAELRDASARTDRELDERQRERDRRRPNYDAVGELLASTVYDGRNLPQLFRVVDPATGRTLGYVEPGDQVNPRRMLGRVVGIVGDRRLDPGLRLRVFDVRRIDVLESAEVD